MKKVININFQGRVVPIEETAYDILNQYVESLRHYFKNEEGRDEIINDIEGRFGELFAETLKKGSTCITDADVNAIIGSMGRPEDFDADEANVQTQLGAEKEKEEQNQSSNRSNQEYAGSERSNRLYRDENHKLLGGVCAGIANYFGIDRLVIRILVLLTIGITFIPYIILWIAVPSSASKVIGSTRKRLFRDPENKIIAGVCGGLANYFGVNVWVPRLLFLIPFISFASNWNNWGMFNLPSFISLSFSPGSLLIYIILWLILPEATTTSDRLEMKGEKVDLNSIKNTIQQDMEGFPKRVSDFGAEIGEKASEWGNNFTKKTSSNKETESTRPTAPVARRSTSLGDVILLLFKIFAYFIIGTVLLAIIITLFSIGIIFTGLLPLKEYILDAGWQSIFAWGTLILFIWVPVIGIITWIVRRIAKIKNNSTTIRTSFIALWLLGIFCLIGLISSLRNDFQYHNNPTETSVKLENPYVSKLLVAAKPDFRYFSNNSWLRMEPFMSIDQDSAIVKNIHLRIFKSSDSLYHLSILKIANGDSRQDAELRAERIDFPINQQDSILEMPKGFAITQNEKFRNQSVYLTLYVPVGKKIEISDELDWGNDFHFEFGWEMDSWRWKSGQGRFEGYDWDTDVEYLMTENGLKSTTSTNDNEQDFEEEFREEDSLPDGENTVPDSSGYRYQPIADEKTTVEAYTQPFPSKPVLIQDLHDITGLLLSRIII